MKPLEAVTLHALLDDYAAKNDAFRIELMGTRAMRRAAKHPPSVWRSVWAQIALACSTRALAVRARLRGNVDSAMRNEEKSEAALREVFVMTRGRH